MGYDLIAYIDFDQDEMEHMVQESGLDKSDSKNEQGIIKLYMETKACTTWDEEGLVPNYYWNRKLNMHDMYFSRSTSFIRDDGRFENRRYHMMIEKRVGEPFPSCLESINWTVRSKRDALDVSEALPKFFPEDKDLLDFAEWLKNTTKYCKVYELSR